MKIERPWLALWIYFGIGFLLWQYGVRDGVLVVVAIIGGIVMYRLLLNWRG